jgi:hypothetical protein
VIYPPDERHLVYYDSYHQTFPTPVAELSTRLPRAPRNGKGAGEYDGGGESEDEGGGSEAALVEELLAEYPLVAESRPWRVTLEAGQALFIPGGAPHIWSGNGFSASVGRNWVDESNVERARVDAVTDLMHPLSKQHGDHVGGIGSGGDHGEGIPLSEAAALFHGMALEPTASLQTPKKPHPDADAVATEDKFEAPPPPRHKFRVWDDCVRANRGIRNMTDGGGGSGGGEFDWAGLASDSLIVEEVQRGLNQNFTFFR